jgi:integrase
MTSKRNSRDPQPPSTAGFRRFRHCSFVLTEDASDFGLKSFLSLRSLAVRIITLPLSGDALVHIHQIGDHAIKRTEVWEMVRRRALDARLAPTPCCHTFRATGITAYLYNGGIIEHAQQIAAHESPRTTKLYNRRGDQMSLDEIERILI